MGGTDLPIDKRDRVNSPPLGPFKNALQPSGISSGSHVKETLFYIHAITGFDAMGEALPLQSFLGAEEPLTGDAQCHNPRACLDMELLKPTVSMPFNVYEIGLQAID